MACCTDGSYCDSRRVTLASSTSNLLLLPFSLLNTPAYSVHKVVYLVVCFCFLGFFPFFFSLLENRTEIARLTFVCILNHFRMNSHIPCFIINVPFEQCNIRIVEAVEIGVLVLYSNKTVSFRKYKPTQKSHILQLKS